MKKDFEVQDQQVKVQEQQEMTETYQVNANHFGCGRLVDEWEW